VYTLHNGAAEIVRLIDYLAGRSSGQYTPNHPFWFKRSTPYHDVASSTVADSVGDSFKFRYIPQQASLGTSQYYFIPMYGPMPSMDDQSYGTSIPRNHRKTNRTKRACVQIYPIHQ
jgi:hypothetical protein